MGRHYIGIEMGDNAVTHCVPRLNKVIEGEQGGISKTVDWQGGGGFRFYRLGSPAFDEDGRINKDIRFPILAAHIWFGETRGPWTGEGVSSLLGIHDGQAYALLYNGILGDKRPNGGNVLTHATLRAIQEAIAQECPEFDGPLTVYGEGMQTCPAHASTAASRIRAYPLRSEDKRLKRMRLKQYQEDALSVLRRFFEESLLAGPKDAYETITQEPELAERLGRYGGKYAPALEDLPQVPYVCLRLPTGGGKTILAAHAVKVARDAWVQKEYPLVLWLVPTNTIREQTAQTLKDNRHPYRQALDDAFNGRVRVFDIADFTHIRPQDIRDNCCVVVGTIQTPARYEYPRPPRLCTQRKSGNSLFITTSNCAWT